MIGPGDIVAHGLRRGAAEEDRPGMAHAREQRLGVGGGDLEMLGGDAVGQGCGLFQLVDDDDRAVIAPARAPDLLSRQQRQRAVDRGFALVGENGIAAAWNALRGGIGFGPPPLAGVTITMRETPATRAGTAFISTELG